MHHAMDQPTVEVATDPGRLAREALNAAPFAAASFDLPGLRVGANDRWQALFLDPDELELEEEVVARLRTHGRTWLTLVRPSPEGAPLAVPAMLVARTAEDDLVGFHAFALGTPTPLAAAGPEGRGAVGVGTAARALGVSASTLRRLVDAGELVAERTEGGHRRIAFAELARFARTLHRPPRLTPPRLPDGPLPVLAGLLAGDRRGLTTTAVRLTYDPGWTGWFARPDGIAAVDGWLEAVAAAARAGRYDGALSASRRLFDLARPSATLEECVVYTERLRTLLLRTLERTDDGRPELRGAHDLLAAARRSFVLEGPADA